MLAGKFEGRHLQLVRPESGTALFFHISRLIADGGDVFRFAGSIAPFHVRVTPGPDERASPRTLGAASMSNEKLCPLSAHAA